LIECQTRKEYLETLERLILAKHKTQSAFCSQYGVSRSGLHRFLDNTRPALAIEQVIHRVLGISVTRSESYLIIEAEKGKP
jgi:NMD protein affecting ribosome stability and mRNA decay